MMDELIKKMRASVAVKLTPDMDFKSPFAERKFETYKEILPEPAEFTEDLACLMQKEMKKLDKDPTNSLFYRMYEVAQACHGSVMDIHQAKASLGTYWAFGDKIAN